MRGAPELKIIRVTPTISTSAYSTGFQFGTVQTLSQAAPDNNYGTVLHSLLVLDKDKQDAAFDFVFFDSSGQTITSTDRTTFNILDANLFGKIVGAAQVTTYMDFSGNSLGFLNGGSVTMAPALGGVDLFVQPIIRSTATYSTTTAVQFVYCFIQDRRD